VVVKIALGKRQLSNFQLVVSNVVLQPDWDPEHTSYPPVKRNGRGGKTGSFEVVEAIRGRIGD
jgi:hypothetical protein